MRRGPIDIDRRHACGFLRRYPQSVRRHAAIPDTGKPYAVTSVQVHDLHGEPRHEDAVDAFVARRPDEVPNTTPHAGSAMAAGRCRVERAGPAPAAARS